MRKLSLAIALLVSLQTFAFDIKPNVFWDNASPNISPVASGVKYQGKDKVSGGILLEFPLIAGLSLETGGLLLGYASKSIDSTINYDVETQWSMISIPVVARYSFLHFLSVGAGPYFSFAAGSKAKVKSVANGTTTTETEPDLTSAAKSDFGILGSFGAHVGLTKSFGLFGDLRYLLGLKNMTDVAGVSAKYNHLLFMAGVTISI